MLRPGGRTERNRRAVASAVLELLKSGDTELTHDKVAETSGVSRSTVYRRWPTRVALLREGLSGQTRNLPVPSTGRFDTDVRALANTLAGFFTSPTELASGVSMALDEDHDFLKWQIAFWIERAQSLLPPFDEAIQRGEIARDTESAVLLEMLVAPMIVRTVLMKQDLPPSFVNRLAEQVIRTAKSDAQPPTAATQTLDS